MDVGGKGRNNNNNKVIRKKVSEKNPSPGTNPMRILKGKTFREGKSKIEKKAMEGMYE